MNSSRCKCVIHRNDGEVMRCKAMIHDPDKDRYCYYHKKVFDGLAFSSPSDMQGNAIDANYILCYTDMETGERRENIDRR